MGRPHTVGRAVVLAAVLAACAPRGGSRPAPTAGGTPQDVQELVRLALTLDATGDRSADTLYAPGAQVIGNARIRLSAPRFAGISPVAGAGRVTVSASTVTLEGRFAWVQVDYRWMSTTERRADAGRATFICEQRAGGWKIVHAHSSQPLPWEP